MYIAGLKLNIKMHRLFFYEHVYDICGKQVSKAE